VLLTYQDLKGRGIRYSMTHLRRLMKAGKFPAAIKLNPTGINLWHEHEVDELIARRTAERDQVGRVAKKGI